MDDYIKNVADNLDLSNKYINVNNMQLRKDEIEVLDRYDIDYKNCNSLKEILCLIEDAFQNSYDEMNDLEEVSISISERDYYVNSNK